MPKKTEEASHLPKRVKLYQQKEIDLCYLTPTRAYIGENLGMEKKV